MLVLIECGNGEIPSRCSIQDAEVEGILVNRSESSEFQTSKASCEDARHNARFVNRTLFQGDNLKYLRLLNSESVDLIADNRLYIIFGWVRKESQPFPRHNPHPKRTVSTPANPDTSKHHRRRRGFVRPQFCVNLLSCATIRRKNDKQYSL